MSRSATSMKKPEPGTLQTYASLRFSGDELEPQRLTAILNARPEVAYRKGDVFKVSRGQEVRGRTGVWVISSKGDIPNGAKPPVIREDIRDRLARIPAEIWADFDTD
ncbi:MAG: hypothetical protein E6G69_10050 [Alphaproteobacteria bacterium]|nr:MAG: hypothetical protein E6G69_10050 [Alphaproteobacteria bacterium]